MEIILKQKEMNEAILDSRETEKRVLLNIILSLRLL
jgi:hypothetical protein